MIGRRGKSFAPTVCIVCALVFAGYPYYLYTEQYSKNIECEGRLGILKKKQSSLISQLQVVYVHRTKLEDALFKERKSHRSTKQDLIGKMRECNMNLTRAKHESMNRFNALDTEHKMLQAKHEEINTDYSNLQQQYVRLSEDHQKIVNGQKEDYERLKDTKEKESRSLQERVQTLYDEKEEQKTEAAKYVGYYRSERNERVRVTNENQRIKDDLTKMEEENSALESQREKLKAQVNDAEKKIKALKENVLQLEKKVKERPNGESDKEDPVVPTNMELQPTKAPVTEKQAVLENKKRSNDGKDANNGEEVSQAITTSKMITARMKTTSKSVKRDVKSKILGKNIMTVKGLDLKPSDKVQRILIGKNAENKSLKKEDSIMDEYEVSETPKPVGSETERGFKFKPLPFEKDSEKETDFQKLVKKGVVTNEMATAEVEKLASDKEGVSIKDSVQEMPNNLDANLEQHLKEEKNAIDKRNLLEKERVSQYSKSISSKKGLDLSKELDIGKKVDGKGADNEVKRESKDNVLKSSLESNMNDRKGVDINDANKAADLSENEKKEVSQGDSFLRKQQQLMHGPLEKRSKSKMAGENEQVAANEDSKSVGEGNEEKHETATKSVDHQETKIVDRSNEDAKMAETNAGKGYPHGRNQLKPPGKSTNEMKDKNGEPEFVNRKKRKQLKPLRKSTNEIEDQNGEPEFENRKKREQLRPPVKEVIDGEETEGKGEDQKKHDVQSEKAGTESKVDGADQESHPKMHVPIGKPKPAVKSSEDEAEHGNDFETEPGDQDLDHGKSNEENNAENIDSDDESRTEEKDFMNKKEQMVDN